MGVRGQEVRCMELGQGNEVECTVCMYYPASVRVVVEGGT